MPLDRYFIDDDLLLGSSLTIRDKEFHHIVNVARKNVDDQIELINGRGLLARALIGKIEKRSIAATIESVIEEPKPSSEIILAQSVPKMNRLDTILEKCSELGVTKFILFPGTMSEKKSLNIERLKAVIIAATKQCGRLWLPEIELSPKLEKWENIDSPAYFGDISQNAPKLLEIWPKKPSSKVIFFIGPESGFTNMEINILKQLGAAGVSIHKNILRTDTAAICALSLISNLIL